MTLEQITEKCINIACNPNENPDSETLNNLVNAASKIKHTLAFHIGHNLLGKPYIQGFTLEPID